MASLQVNVSSPSITMNGNKTVTSSLNWTPPNLPVGTTVTSATLTGSWTWNGKGSVSQMIIGGTSTSDAIQFTHVLTDTEISNNSISISATGANKNVTGNNFTWTGLVITYEYELPKIQHQITIIQSTGGTIISDKTNASAGEKVNLTFQPDDGYDIGFYVIIDEIFYQVAGEEYSFDMPDKDIEISMTWGKIYTISINDSNNIGCIVTPNAYNAVSGTGINVSVTILEGYTEPYTIYVNGSSIEGTSFVMPEENVEIYAVATKIDEPEQPTDILVMKEKGVYNEFSVGKKIDGVWVLQTELENIFNPDIKYHKIII